MNTYTIYQLRRADDTAQYRYMNYTWLEKRGEKPHPDMYEAVFGDHMTAGTTLEDIYYRFNTLYPLPYNGHAVSVSDIIRANRDGKISYHYVDSIGFKELGGFRMEDE